MLDETLCPRCSGLGYKWVRSPITGAEPVYLRARTCCWACTGSGVNSDGWLPETIAALDEAFPLVKQAFP